MNAIEALEIVKDGIRRASAEVNQGMTAKDAFANMEVGVDNLIKGLKAGGFELATDFGDWPPKEMVVRLDMGEIFDTKVKPALAEIMATCTDAKIAFLATVHVPRAIRNTLQLVAYTFRSYH
jgi:hypothetical protein